MRLANAIGHVESIMKSNEGWRRHLCDLMSSRVDALVYAVQWARDPRCIQGGVGHRRVGAFANDGQSVCRLWSGKSMRDWS